MESIGLSVLRGWSSLFGNSKPKLIITAFEEEALRQLKEIRDEREEP